MEIRDPTDIGLSEEPPAGLGAKCPYFQHAQRLADHGDLEAARDIFLRSVDVDFCNAAAWSALSLVYAEMDELEHAAEAARQAVRSDADDPEWLLVLSDHLLALEKHGECEKVLGSVLKMAPVHPVGFFNRAILRTQQGRFDDALSDIKRAVELEPTLADAAINVEDFDAIREMAGFPPPLEAEGFNPNSPFAHLKIDSQS